MNNKLNQLFANRDTNLLNIYCTAGFPQRDSTCQVVLALQAAGVDMVEIGIPYSDPVADGPVIQESSSIALKNGMTISLLFDQLRSIKDQLSIPVILMGYFNPILQYGVQQFCHEAREAGVSAVIIPDLPFYEYEKNYQVIFEAFQIGVCFLVSPSSSIERIKKADRLSSGFIYVVSSAATTGKETSLDHSLSYFEQLQDLQLKNKLMIGFGIRDNKGFKTACSYSSGAIIGTAFIKHIKDQANIDEATRQFINAIRAN